MEGFLVSLVKIEWGDGGAVVDLDSFVDAHVDIWSKYDSREFYRGCGPDSQGELSRRVDRYILHTVEEIDEALQETPGTQAWWSEMADVTKYLATLDGVLREVMEGSGVEAPRRPIRIYQGNQGSRDLEGESNSVLIEVLGRLMSARRLFPERKWHKPHPEVSSAAAAGRATVAHSEIRRALEMLFGWCASAGAEGRFRFEEALSSKHAKTLSLPDVATRV